MEKKQFRTNSIRRQITQLNCIFNSPQIKQSLINSPKNDVTKGKQNCLASGNISLQNKDIKSPKIAKKGLKKLQIVSPQKDLVFPSGFRSNKSSQTIIDIKNQLQKQIQSQQTEVIYTGLSKDAKFKITSKAFYGQQLQKANSFQIKSNYRAKLGKFKPQYFTYQKLPKIEQSKASIKENGVIKSYAVNTHQGISRNYNQDRVSIILNINKNNVKTSFFAIYDGHGGAGCADYLRDYLHQNIINHPSFVTDTRKALHQGIIKTQVKFMQVTKRNFIKNAEIDRSGSCSIVVMIVGNQCFVANVGDSRAFLSQDKGRKISNLSRDHKPADKEQQNRVIANGGKIYRTQMTKIDKLSVKDKQQLDQSDHIVGPLRVFPGKLSVTRTFGDIQAKDKDFGGTPNCITVQPEIIRFKVTQTDDFIFIGCDGIFQKLQSQEVNKIIWKQFQEKQTKISIHKRSGKCIQQVIKQCMRRKCNDNLTGIFIGLKGSELMIQNESKQARLLREASFRSL